MSDCGLCHGIEVGETALALALKGWENPTPLFPSYMAFQTSRPSGSERASGGAAEGCLDMGRVKQPGHEE